MESALVVERPLISVAVPAYKSAFLEDCIGSILSQTYTNFEIVIVNDASPYDLDSVVEKFRDERIRYYKNAKNYGAVDVVNNWNRCLELAKGGFIICMGDDDMLSPCCLEEYVKLIEKYPNLGVYHARTEIIDEQSRFKSMTEARPEWESVYSLIWHQWNSRHYQYIGDFLFNAELLRKNGGFYYLPLAWASDYISVAMAAIPAGIANTEKIGFRYRVNDKSISRKGRAEYKLQAICGEMTWYEQFLGDTPQDEMDYKYWLCLKRQLRPHFERKKRLTVASDLSEGSILKCIKWIRNRRKYGLSKTIIFSAIYESIKLRRC